MSSNDSLETNGKANKKRSVVTQDDKNSSESKKVESRLTDSPEPKENIYTSKKSSKIATKQARQGLEDKHKRQVYSPAEDKEQNSTTQQQSSLHVRYWTYLFDNLHRSIDEIFCACESEENVSGCHEALRTMEVYRRDFEMLIKRIETQRAFESATDQDNRPPLVWEVRASPPRTNCPVTLVLPEEEPRAVSPLVKKRSPKRRIDFKNDEQQQSIDRQFPENSSEDGATSWADMVKNGYQRADSKHGIAKSKENSSNSSSKQKNQKENSGKNTPDNNNMGNSTTKLNKEASYCYTEACEVEESSNSSFSSIITAAEVPKQASARSEKKPPSCEFSGAVVDATNMEEDEGWEVVSRSRGKPGRKGFYKIQSALSTAYSFTITSDMSDYATTEKGSCKQNHGKCNQGNIDLEDNSDPGIHGDDNSDHRSVNSDHHESNIDPDQHIQHSHGNNDSDCHSDNDPENVKYCHDGDNWQNQDTTVVKDNDLVDEEGILQRVDGSSVNSINTGRVISPDIHVVLSDNSVDTDVSSAGAGKSALSQSWPERSSSFLEAYSTRRTPHTHQKLASPQRKRYLPTTESKRTLDEKLAAQSKAKLQRDKPQDKLMKSHVEKTKDVQDDDITEQRRALIEEKLQRAEMKRVSLLQEKIKKAQEEEAKLNEIAFINTLEAQNKKIEVLTRHQGHEARLQDIQEERQRKKEEQQAKEEAAQERRRTLEAERLAKLVELDQKRKENDARIEQLIHEREKAREEAAKEKARERERKLEARNEAITSSIAELEKKIQLKQDKSSKRYDMQLEQRKEKAAVASRHVSPEDAPRVTPYERKKWCSVCNVKIVSELYLLSHLRGKRHQEAVASLPTEQSDPSLLILEIPEEQIRDEITMETAIAERIRAGKKRAKKIKQRVAVRAKDYETTAHSAKQNVQLKTRFRFQKLLRDVNKLIETNSSNIWASADVQLLDRVLGELKRSFTSQSGGDDRLLFCHLDGMNTLLGLLMLYNTEVSFKCLPIPYKSFRLASAVMGFVCGGSLDNSKKFVLCGLFVPLIDTLCYNLSLQIPNACQLSSSWGGDGAKPTVISDQLQYICGPLLNLLAKTLSTVAQSKLEPVLEQALHDFIGYMVCSGLIDQLHAYFSVVYGPLDDCHSAQLVLDMLNILVATTALFHYKVKDVFSDKLIDDPTQLIDALQRTELVGIASLLYAILLHSGPPRHSTVPPSLSTYTISVTTAAVKCINNVALMNIKWFQHCLGAEGISLQFRHTASYLLWHCSHHSNEVLLDEVILAIGYFCVLNPDNQVFLQSGRSPTVLQLLCALPLDYFTTPRLINLLFPTLVSICFNNEANMVILSKEIDCQSLCKYLQEQIDRREKRSADLKSLSDLQYRFPTEHWKSALLFFKQNYLNQQ